MMWKVWKDWSSIFPKKLPTAFPVVLFACPVSFETRPRVKPGDRLLSSVARFHCVRLANRFARNGNSGFLSLRMRARHLKHVVIFHFGLAATKTRPGGQNSKTSPARGTTTFVA